MEKLLLVAGCSHTTGSEIDGMHDSVYNRQHSYGNRLAKLLNRTPINIADPGTSNIGIGRSIIDWLGNEYNADSTDLFILIGWTESIRMEIPSQRIHWYDKHNEYHDWFSLAARWYWRCNPGWYGGDNEEKEVIPLIHKFMATHEYYIEIQSMINVLQIQYQLKYLNIPYLMCNTMHMFTEGNTYLDVYRNNIDADYYYNWNNNDESFYWKYKNLGHVNEKAKYWHHGEIPHQLYAEELYNYMRSTNVYNQVF